MKLYFSPGACSLSPHIVLIEAGLKFTLEKVDLKTKQMANGGDFKTINPMGAVPALQLDDGLVLTEGSAIVQYLADLVPQKHLAPAAGTIARYQLMAWLNFVASEIHKGFGPMFMPGMPDDAKKLLLDRLIARLGYVETELSGDYLMGDEFTVADAYLYTILRWRGAFNLTLDRWPKLDAYFKRIDARPAVQAALAAEK